MPRLRESHQGPDIPANGNQGTAKLCMPLLRGERNYYRWDEGEMNDRRKEQLTKEQRKEAFGAMGFVFASLLPEWKERPGPADRRVKDNLAGAMEFLEAACNVEPDNEMVKGSKHWNFERQAIRLIIETMERRGK